MTRKNRSAFTLVELLVVVAIIGMLVALLVQAVIGAREAARRAKCLNYQEEIAKAVAAYEQAKQQLPGYCNANLAIPALQGDLVPDWVNAGKPPRRRPGLSWAVMLLPYLGRDDLFAAWRTCYLPGNPPLPTVGVPIAQAFVNSLPNLAQFVCPSDSEKINQLQGGAPLSYVVNSGLPDCTEPGDCPSGVTNIWTNGPNYGLFMDGYCHRQITVTTANIADGASNTIMLSENLQATSVVPPAATHPEQWDVAMVWWPRQAPVPPVSTPILVNGDKAGPTDLWHARPSSNHPGGVVAAFADGSARFISQDIDYAPTASGMPVYQQMMCPNDNAASAMFGFPGS